MLTPFIKLPKTNLRTDILPNPTAVLIKHGKITKGVKKQMFMRVRRMLRSEIMIPNVETVVLMVNTKEE